MIGKSCGSGNASPWLRLNPIDHEMLELRVLKGLGYERIGRKFGVSKERVRQRVARAYMVLLQALNRLSECQSKIHQLEAHIAKLEIESQPLGDRDVDTLELGTRALNVLRKARIRTIGELVGCQRRDLMRKSGCWEKTIMDIETALSKIGLRLRD